MMYTLLTAQNGILFLTLLSVIARHGAFRPHRKPPVSHKTQKADGTQALDPVILTEENYDHSIVGKEYWLDLFLGSDKSKGGNLSAQSESSDAVIPTIGIDLMKDRRRGSIDVNKLINSRDFKNSQETGGPTLENSKLGTSIQRHKNFNSYLDAVTASTQGLDKENGGKGVSGLENRPAWTPDLGAWRVAVPEVGEKDAELRSPSLLHPPLLFHYLQDAGSSLSKFHEEKVQELWQSVQKGSVRELGADSARVVESLRVAYTGLWGKTTARSLDVSINRARGIAAVLGEMKADADVVVAGILHEVVAEFRFDDNYAGLRVQLVDRFGEASISLAETYGRLPKLLAKRQAFSPSQSEDQIQMLVAFVEDYRCLYIRLADRVSTLRALKRLPLNHEERIKIATESLHVYAPLAHKMGLMKAKGELEDLAFKVISPEAFQQSRYTQTSANKAYHEVAEQIQEMIRTDPYLLSQNGRYRLTYRIKDKYQLQLKMDRKGFKSLSDVKDALGLRIIISVPQWKNETDEQHEQRGEDLCYYLTDRLKVLPGWEPDSPVKDYIAGMKDNGYQSLHLYIRNKAVGTHVETQVRTMAMHKVAELGEAAHWYYKDQIYRPEIAASKQYLRAWRSNQQLSASSPAALLGMAKAQLLKNRVFVLLADKATVLNLRRGATALDAAFAIHSSLGLRTGDITVNGKKSRYDRILRNGDIISVSRNDEPDIVSTAQPAWLTMVRTDAAKRSLRLHFAKEHRVTEVAAGTVTLMMMLHLNAEAIKRRNFGSLPDANQLSRFANQRCGDHIGAVLQELGRAQRPEIMKAIVGALLDMPPTDLEATSASWSLKWIRLQCTHGWVNHKMRANTLMPLLGTILPSFGYDKARLERRWTALVGALRSEQSPYFKSLSRHLTMTRGGAAPALDGFPAEKESMASATGGDSSDGSGRASFLPPQEKGSVQDTPLNAKRSFD